MFHPAVLGRLKAGLKAPYLTYLGTFLFVFIFLMSAVNKVKDRTGPCRSLGGGTVMRRQDLLLLLLLQSAATVNSSG